MRFHMISVNGGPSEMIGQADDGKMYHLDALYRRAADSAVTIRSEQVTIDSLLRSNDPMMAAKWMAERLGETPEVDPKSDLSWDVPVRQGDLICVGRNYVAHARELGNETPGEPILFMKPRASLLPHGGTILLPTDSERVDYEGELALVIGRNLAGDVTEEEARRSIFGMTLVNDVTDRAAQNRLKEAGKPWTTAKGRHTFCPMGPSIRTLLYEDDLVEFSIQTKVDGELCQQGDPSLWLFSAVDLIQYIARTFGLHQGDIIATGTPEGVGPLRDGNRVEVSSPAIGILRNPVRSAPGVVG